MNILVIVATFLAAGVEWVEAFTIVLAVGLIRGWRSAALGAAAAMIALVLLVALFGVAITSRVSIDAARTVVGIFLLLFGLKWLYKAILRSSGLKSLHDEAKTFNETRELLEASGTQPKGVDRVGFSTSFGGVFLEGLEVVFIVVALGGLQNGAAAVVGAVASLVVVGVAGLALRHPLTQVPENTMKYVVGIMLTSFGTFFAGEGIGVHWWRSDLSLVPLIAAYAIASVVFVWLLKRPVSPSRHLTDGVGRSVLGAAREVWGLFVEDGALAVLAVTVLLAVTVYADHFADQRVLAGILLVVGILAAVAVGLSGAYRESHRKLNAMPDLGKMNEHEGLTTASLPEETAVG
ncbi:MAG TPA: hypothetical protein VNU19_01665 [Candidatus Acidoferrum sp.]|jgi:uncharacterized membrane protein|nr:hypothetical protein [Candidatus Acidoferrum sp.]